MTENHSPLEQFTIKRIFDLNLGGIDVSFTNSAAFMIVSIILIGSLMILGARKKLLIPNRWQNLVEITYELVAKTVRDNIGDEGKKFFPFIFSLFIFILFCNGLGLIPYSFTVTSHIIVTFTFATLVFVGVTVLGFFRHGLKFFSIFLYS